MIAVDHCINGRPLSESIERFPELMERSFKRRTSLHVPLLSRVCQFAISYWADGLYSAGKIESVLKETLGADKHLLDCSYATSTGTKVGLPVATVSRHPSYRILTNYNGVGVRDPDQGASCPPEAARRYSALTRAKTDTSSNRATGQPMCRFGKCRVPASRSRYTD